MKQLKLLLKYLELENISENELEILFIKQRDLLAAFVGNNVEQPLHRFLIFRISKRRLESIRF